MTGVQTCALPIWQLAGMCDIELIVPHDATARIQEAQKLMFHVLCEWVDGKVE